MIKKMLNNYLIPPKNGCLIHIDPKLYIKCPLGCMVDFLKSKDELKEWNMNLIYYVMNFSNF
jgi:hypothetical protein